MSEEGKAEGIRAWYRRTTRRSMKALGWATAACVIGMAAMWLLASLTTLQHLQTFNGALSVPLLGGIWIFFFIFGFLIPSREASFRGQEALESGVAMLREAIDKKVDPAVQVWKRIGEKVEKKLEEGLIDDFKDAVKDLREAAIKLKEGNDEVRPVVASLRKIQEKIERDNILVEIHEGAKALRALGRTMDPASPVPDEPGVDQPQVGKALNMVLRADPKKNGGRA